MSATGYKRVYASRGFYFFVDPAGKWHRLCRLDEGEPAMLRALARVKNPPESRAGSMATLIHQWRTEVLPKGYSEDTQYDYGLMLDKIAIATRDLDVVEINAGHIIDLRNQWSDKPRTANKYRMLLSLLLAYAVNEKLRDDNPCRDVAKLKVKKRKRYLSHDELRLVIQGLLLGNDSRANASGPMIVLMVLFCYLTGLRMKDARLLTWAQIDDVITVQPTKTKESTGVVLEIEMTREIEDILQRAKALSRVILARNERLKNLSSLVVFHNLDGRPYSKSGVETAWGRACERQGIENAWFRDLRPKALSDAKRAGVTLQVISESAGHSSLDTTADYIRGFEARKSALGLTLPKSKKAGRQD